MSVEGVGLGDIACVYRRRKSLGIAGLAAVEDFDSVDHPVIRDTDRLLAGAARNLNHIAGLEHVVLDCCPLSPEYDHCRGGDGNSIGVGLACLDGYSENMVLTDLVARSRMECRVREIGTVVADEVSAVVKIDRKRILEAVIYRALEADNCIGARRQREGGAGSADLPYCLDYRNEVFVRIVRPWIRTVGIVRGESSEAETVKIDGLVVVVMDNHVLVGLVGTLLRGPAASSDIKFLNDKGACLGMQEAEADTQWAVVEPYTITGRVEDVTAGTVAERDAVDAVRESSLGAAVAPGEEGVAVSGQSVFHFDIDS